jgi:hypothetical protein
MVQLPKDSEELDILVGTTMFVLTASLFLDAA